MEIDDFEVVADLVRDETVERAAVLGTTLRRVEDVLARAAVEVVLLVRDPLLPVWETL